jgi:hypothetical protein
MKKLSKLQINSDRLMKNEELMTLRGGYGSYSCYRYGWMPDGWCDEFITYINTASCSMAMEICYYGYGGGCVCGGDCASC